MGNMNVTVVDQNNVTIAVTPTPTQIVNVDRGILGPRGYSGISGYSGYSGISGYSGFSGISGWSGESGYSGFSGISGYSGDSGISGYSGDSGISGYSGDSGISGYSGDSGISGFSGESGTSGYSGFSGQQGTSINVKGEVPTVGDLPPTGNQVNDAYIVTADGDLWIWDGSAWFDAGQIVGPQGLSGFSGYSGESGYSGFSGDSGISGWSGDSGISGFSGDSGISGWSGFSGESGYSGINGDSGYSGISGYSGFSGDSGISGWSGDSGISGYSGDSGISGWSGESGISGYSGYSGISGYSGWSGEVGTSGFSGKSGYSGFSGISGYSGSGVSGYSGYSGAVGTSGYSGYSGAVGESGFSGISGWSGKSGYSGFSGISGYSGAVGQSSSLFLYYAEAVQTSGQPANGFLLWNTATQSNATQINVSHLTNNGDDIDIFLALLQPTQKFIIQDQNVSANYQSWLITGTTTNVNAGTGNSYWTIPVSLISSGGTGTTDFADNHPLFLAITAGVSGTSGYSGYSGFSGISGWSGISGASGISGQNGASGFSGTSGFSGISGYSGFSGISGQNGASGYSGYSGISGTNGASGFSGISGYSGYSGINGASGFSGYSGISGYSGSGVSGYSGFSGISGYSGYSGITPTIGGSNTQVQYNNSGVLGGSSGLTWDGTYLTSFGGINFSGYTSSALSGGYGVRSLAGLGTQVVSSYRIGLSINGGTSDALTIINSGGVSIGTTADAGANNLTVNGVVGIGTSSINGLLNLKGTNGQLVLANGNTSGGMKITATDVNYTANGYLAFEGYANEYARFNSSGQFGIGTASPSVPLHILNSGEELLRLATSGVNPYLSFFTGTTTRKAYIQLTSSGLLYDSEAASTAHIFGIQNAEKMRLTSTGLGIGTSSPATKLHVDGTSTFTDYIYGGVSGIVYFNADIAISATKKLYLDNGSNTYLSEVTSDTINFVTGGSEKMRIDSSGNLGLGVTPSPFSSGRTVLEIGGYTTGNIAFNGNATNGYQVWCNSYFNYGNFYYANGYATNFGSGNGEFFWNLAPNNTSGAGAVATFTQAMTLTASGNLLVGGTSNGSNAKFISESTANANQLGFRYTGVATYYWGCDSSGNAILNKDGTERMRITSGGLVSITGAGTEVLALNKLGGASAYLQPVSNTDASLQVKDSGGTVTLTVGTNSTTVALQGGTVSSGTGITFPSSQNASSNANTLDDYEEGTWTPTIAGDGTAFTGTTYNGNNGKYVKIGDVVYISFDITVLLAGIVTGVASISGIPFAIPNSSDLSNGGGGIGYITNIQQNYVYQSCYPQNNSNYLFIIGRTSASNQTTVVLSSDFFANSIRITGWAWWRTTV